MRHAEPRGVEHLQVVGEQGHAGNHAPTRGSQATRRQCRPRRACGSRRRASRAGHLVAIVAIDAVQARRTACDVVGLLLEDETERPGSTGRAAGRLRSVSLTATAPFYRLTDWRRVRHRQVVAGSGGTTTASYRSRLARSRPSRTVGVAAYLARCGARRVVGRVFWAGVGRVCSNRRRSSSRRLIPTRRRSGLHRPPRRLALWAYAS